jgi:hypothetical protein
MAQLRVKSGYREQILEAQQHDDEVSKVRIKLELGGETLFRMGDDGIVMLGRCMYVPDNKALKQKLLREAHESKLTVHPGSPKMYQDMKQYYWWPNMRKEVAGYVAKCSICQQVKVEHRKPARLLQPLPIPKWKWKMITMDFASGLLRGKRGNDAIWVIVDQLTKSAFFLPVKMTDPVDKLAKIYVNKVVRLHGVPISIVSDRDPRFTSRLWPSIKRALGTNLSISTASHPQTDGQSKRVIQILEDLLRACALEFGGNWEEHLSLVEFTYNNNYQTTIGMAPFEALYGRKCRTPLCWEEVGDKKLYGAELIQITTEKVRIIKDRIKVAQDRQKKYADI